MSWLTASLRGRLLLAATILIAAALIGTAAVTYVILDHFMHRQIDQQLDSEILALRSTLVTTAAGMEEGRQVDGPPFDRPGWYWQINSGGSVLRSRSLSGHTLDIPAGPPVLVPPPPPPNERASRPLPDLFEGGPPRPGDGPGPDGQSLHFRTKTFAIGGQPITITATAPQDAFVRPLRDAMTPVLLALLITAAALVAAMMFQVQLGLKPLQVLRRAVADIRAGRAERLPGGQPLEIAPLTDELNKLIADNAHGLARSRRHVANLAHGLKTPLANLSLALQRHGDSPELQALVGVMDRRIRHHLARARVAALDGPARAQTRLGTRVSDVVAAMMQIHAERGIACEVVAEPDAAVRCEPQDVDEMLGNLVDNAFKWAASQVRISVQCKDASTVIRIEDDGPGLTTEAIANVIRPGQRLDEHAPGYGFGLPIARELAELYGGHLVLERAALGGLSASLTLPRAT